MAAGDGATGAVAQFNEASVHLVFQQRPGTERARRITDGGEATLTLHSGVVSQVIPVNGIYHFDLPLGEDAVLELFGTQYRIVRAIGANDPDPSGSTTIVVWDNPLRALDTMEGQLQRLQILGYYTGALSPDMNDFAEKAILEFQEDHGLVIDGVVGPNTQTKLGEIYSRSGHVSGSVQPLIRKYLACFGRANSESTRMDSPQLDFRGSGNPKLILSMPPLAAPAQAGDPIPTPLPEFYRLAFLPIHLDETSAPWHAVMRSGGTVINLRQPILDNFGQLIEFNPAAVGSDVMDIHQGAADGPVIASLDIQIVLMKEVLLWGHLLNVSETGTGALLADPPMWTIPEAQSLIDFINAIWNPAGIRFVFRGFTEHNIVQPHAGLITEDSIHNHRPSRTIARAHNRRGFLNVYFTQCLNYIWNNADDEREEFEPVAFAGNRWQFNPSFVYTGKLLALPELARALAHEFGHMLRLTSAQYSHSDDRGVSIPWRHDIWSRMRLMSKYLLYDRANPPTLSRPWQDTTYGENADGLMRAGDLITIKNFSHDDSDNEATIARRSAENPYA